MKLSTRIKVRNLIKNLGFKRDELNEIIKLYDFKPFNRNDKGYKKLIKISKDLCNKYTELYYMVDANNFKNSKERRYFLKKKKDILKKLVPWKRNNVVIRDNVSYVSGLVEFGRGSFINSYAEFPYDAITKLGKFTTFGPCVKFLKQQSKSIDYPALNIVEDKCWLCAGCNIYPNITIHSNSVIAAGTILKKSTQSYSVNMGRNNPKAKELSPYVVQACKFDKEYNRMLRYIKENYPYAYDEYKKAISGNAFNDCESGLQKLYKLTRDLCTKYSKLISNPIKNKIEINRLINLLFPYHGKNFHLGKNISLDLLGTVLVGDNVWIDDCVFLAGKIKIGNNVKIGKNVIAYASTHSTYWKERRCKGTIHGVKCQTYLGHIIFKDNISVGTYSNIVVNSEVKHNVPSYSLIVKGKNID